MANPPITIGPFTNVPAPGSAIASAWAQDISRYVSRRCGVGVSQANQNFAAGAEAAFAWNTEVYDTDAFHVAGSTDIVIPAGLGGLYVVTLFATATGAVPSQVQVRIRIAGNDRPGYIPSGSQALVMTWTGVLAPGNVVQGRWWQGNGGANFTNASMEVNRLLPS